MKKGDKVIMTDSDGFAEKGWIGIVENLTPFVYYDSGNVAGDVVRVAWDNGKRYLHRRRTLNILSEINDPNLLFSTLKR